MSLYSQYIQERDGISTIEKDGIGFITYKISGDECYIENIYVVPSERRSGHGKSLLDQVIEVAIENKCKYLTSNIRPYQRAVATLSMKAQLAVGFVIHSIVGDSILMIKELNYE